MSRNVSGTVFVQAPHVKTSATASRRGLTLTVGALWLGTLAVSLAAARYSASVVATPHGNAAPDPLATQFTFLAVYVIIATVGAVVALRRPRHPVGWLFLVSAWLFGTSELAHGYAHHAVLTGTTDTSLAQWAGLIGVVLFLPPFVMMTMYLALIFPSGKLLSPRWRILVGVLVAAVGALTLVEILSPGPLPAFPEMDNPLGVPRAAASLDIVTSIVDPLFFPIVASIAVSVVLRFRRATPAERQQFKWVALPAAVLLVFLPVNELYLVDSVGAVRVARDIVFFAAFAGLPIGLAIAVLRYRLYDIDRIVSRTVAYVALSVVLLAVYAAGAVTLGTTVPAITGSTSNELVVALSTLAVAALFQPTRRRIQSIVDRRFNRAHYDAAHTIEQFGQRLRNELDPDTLLREIRRVVDTSMQPMSTSVWTKTQHGTAAPTTGRSLARGGGSALASGPRPAEAP